MEKVTCERKSSMTLKKKAKRNATKYKVFLNCSTEDDAWITQKRKEIVIPFRDTKLHLQMWIENNWCAHLQVLFGISDMHATR